MILKATKVGNQEVRFLRCSFKGAVHGPIEAHWFVVVRDSGSVGSSRWLNPFDGERAI